MRFLKLFGVRVRHDYYADAVCRDLAFVPTAATRRLIERYRLRLRELPDGIDAAAPAGPDGKAALIPVARGETFVFELHVRDPDFVLFTDLQDFAGKTDPVYTNAALPADSTTLKLADRKSWNSETFAVPPRTSRLKLTLAGNPMAADGNPRKAPLPADFSIQPRIAGAKVTAYDAAAKTLTLQLPAAEAGASVSLRYRAAAAADPAVLAQLELSWGKAMPDPGNEAAPFEIRFSARAGRWAYYLITDQTGDFSIVDSGPSGARLAFSAANRSLLNDVPEEPDALAAALARQYPDFQRIRFLSDQPVACSSARRTGIELRLGGEKVIEAMPNPPARHLSRIKRQVGAGLQDQDTFHQVVKYVKAH